jgi:hypothetical protein
MPVRIGPVLLLALLAGCTPTRHRIPPPYPYQGQEHSAAEIEAIAAERCLARTQTGLPPHTFTTDGCSLWPDGNYRACCIEHDMRYWCAGPTQQRRPADQALRECVAGRSSAFNAALVYWGVRLGGGRALPFPWRWGYGYPWIYQPPPDGSHRAPGASEPVATRPADMPL